MPALIKESFVRCPKTFKRVNVSDCENDCEFFEDMDDLVMYCGFRSSFQTTSEEVSVNE